MPISSNHWGLYTDFYELTMAQGYFYCGKKDDTTTFNYFFRTNPYQGGFTVFAGLHDFLKLLLEYTFNETDIAFLEEQGFNKEFLEYLRTFKFSGNIISANEGEIMFPGEPVLQIEGNIIECQLIESMLLNILNFESLVATKAFRTKLVANGKVFSDFGLRRAQGLGAIHGSRAAKIGGAASTSNVLAGKLFDIPLSGTQAHSWIQSFDTELEAFRAFARTHPEDTILLVDTYDSLMSGIPNAITVAKELEKEGNQMQAIRLDSGDLAYLSKKARKMLDDAKLEYVKILASNQLNEYVVKSLIKDQNAPIDGFGIGTELITGKSDAALDGVYKLVEINGRPKMKLSENIEKVTLPCKKQVYRCFGDDGTFYRDAILVADENPEEAEFIFHPVYPERKTQITHLHKEPLLNTVVKAGEIIREQKGTDEIHQYLSKRSELLPEEHKRFISPHIYKVGISQKLMETRDALTKQLLKKSSV
ncbi:nicotinate phosphoribosyltransferase [Mariniphaga anaerophila]|uniref:Nicotinate phosphoribosyltransferase n=1 Tax=Mariniphaga anaerophila TaxID=1484053 RepID=A0A1M5FY79_9BACT|nr:nicotinate phosphoribosyltransferase [Mariniphaga anaerophila]SHF96485.1 nicotinate phosphoribosyltransferase [Mariniphaga anaerophila]